LAAIKARVAVGGLLLLLIWQTAVAVRAEAARVSVSRTAASLTASLEQRYAATCGAHHVLLAAVWAHAPDARRLIVVRDPRAAVEHPPGLGGAGIDRSAPKDMLVPHLTTLLFPVDVRELHGLLPGAAALAELLEPTTYVLDLRPGGGLAALPALRTVATGDGFELLRNDPAW
jgi:hypothetical protein